MKLGDEFIYSLKDLELEQVVLTKFDLTQSIRNYRGSNEHILKLKKETRKLIKKLDERPFLRSCDCNWGCNSTDPIEFIEPLQYSLKRQLSFFKDSLGNAEEPKLKTYEDVVNYLGLTNRNSLERENTLKIFTYAKGLKVTNEITPEIAKDFFSDEPKLLVRGEFLHLMSFPVFKKNSKLFRYLEG